MACWAWSQASVRRARRPQLWRSGSISRFDLRRSFWLISGVCGIDPARGSLASVVLPEFVVEGGFRA